MPGSHPPGSRPARDLVRGVLALALVAVVVVALPVWLWRTVGWPLPHAMPTPADLRAAVLHESLSDQVILNGLAVLTWLAWAQFIACLVVEAKAALRGRLPGHVPLAAWGTQALAARLVTAALVLAPLTTPVRPAVAAAPPPAAHTTIQRPITITPPAPAGRDTPPAAHQPPPANGRLAEHVVQPHDTLWDLAERYFGDGRRFREIFDHNQGRPQPDGRRLTNPNRIRPGWILAIPNPPATADEPADAGSPAAAGPRVQHPPTPPPRTHSDPDQVPAPERGPAQPPASIPPPHPPAAPAARPADGSSDTHEPARPPAGPHIQLPSGSVVGITLAAAITAALTLAWRHQRRTRRLQPPQASLAATHPLLTPTVRRLLRAVRAARPTPAAPSDRSIPTDAPTRPAPDGRALAITIGQRHRHPVVIDLAAAGPLGLDGEPADASLRAIATTLLATTTPGTAQLLIAGDPLHQRLLGDTPPLAAVTVAEDLDAALATLELEVLHRTRLLDHHDLDDLDAYTRFDPAEPLPTLVLLADHTQPRHSARLSAILTTGQRLGITAITLGAVPNGTTIGLDHTATVTTVHPADQLPALAGTRLYTLTATETSELTSVLVAATATTPPAPPQPQAEPVPPATPPPHHHSPTPHPDPTAATGATDPPVDVQLLGPPKITVAGQELAAGLRRKARELLAFLLLHPAGVTRDAAIDALWPDTDPTRAHDYFKVVLGNLRQELRPDHPGVTAVERAADRYRANPAVIDCDLWRFHRALTRATQTQDPTAKTTALTDALAAYRGELLDGADQDWALATREELRRQACDTAGALAELHEQAGQPDQALTVLEHAAGWDPYNEELHQRIMRLQARLGRPDAIRRTLQRLQTRLEDDLGVDPSDTTMRQARQLLTPTGDQPNHSSPARPGRPPRP